MSNTVSRQPALQYGKIEIDTPVVLAPMAGITNTAFRRLCREFGGGLYVSEMVTSRALVEQTEGSLRIIGHHESEDIRSVQLYGVDPVTISRAIKLLVDQDKADHIDLNFGCPVPKVTRKGGGAALPWKRDLFEAIVNSAVKAAGDLPVTVKMRKGIDADHLTYIDAGKAARDAGVAAVALHGRTAEDFYSGKADWEAIAELRESLPDVQVLGNGDIWTASDALRMIEATGCDGVVIGRGCLGRPWLFADLVAAFSGGEVLPPRNLGFVVEVMKRHVRSLAEHFGADDVGSTRGVRDFRKHVSWYLTGFPVGGEIRHRLATADSILAIDDLLDEMVSIHGSHLTVVEGGEYLRRGKTSGPIRVSLPDGYRGCLNDMVVPDDNDVMAISGG